MLQLCLHPKVQTTTQFVKLHLFHFIYDTHTHYSLWKIKPFGPKIFSEILMHP